MPFFSKAAPTQGLAAFDEHLVRGDSTAEPGMPWITDVPPLSIMCVELSTSIIGVGRIWGSRRTRQILDPSRQRPLSRSSRFRKWVACMTATNGRQHKQQTCRCTHAGHQCGISTYHPPRFAQSAGRSGKLRHIQREPIYATPASQSCPECLAVNRGAVLAKDRSTNTSRIRSRCCWFRSSSQSKHSERAVRTNRSATPLACGARNGVRSIPSLRNTSSKRSVNLLSRSRIRNRIGSERSAKVHDSCRACWMTHGAFGFGVQPATRKRRLPNSMKKRT